MNIKYPDVRRALTISREDYIIMQQSFISSPNEKSEYVYSVRPSYQYSFIEYDGVTYIPLPHLLTKNITTSFLYRLTENKNNGLRQKIGKYNLEAYLLNIVQGAKVYDEVSGELEYTGHNRSQSKSPDVIARYGNSVLFLDSKSTAPSAKMRLIDLDAFANSIDIVSGYIVQLHNQIRQFDKYNPFRRDVSYNADCFWGAVVVLEDSYVMRKQYYDDARKKLGLQEDSAEWKWLVLHIKVLDLYTVERACYTSMNLITAMEKASESGSYGDYSILNYIDMATEFTDGGINNFRDRVKKDMADLAADMHEKKLI